MRIFSKCSNAESGKCERLRKFWLCKSEPEVYSIDDLKRDKRTLWDSVRNYQARNFLLQMKPGDLVCFYHSNAEPAGIAGIAKVSKAAVPDPTQFEKTSEYFEKRASKEKPVWFAPELAFVAKFKTLISRDELRAEKKLASLLILQKGSRLSVTPLSKEEFETIESLGA